MRTVNWRLVALLLLVAVGAVVQQMVFPLMEGADEPLHYNYAEYLRQANHLPERATYRTNPTRQESGQPPLTYWVGALLTRARALAIKPTEDMHAYLETVKNPWFTPPDLWNRRDNLNVYQHGPGLYALNDPTVVTVLRTLRWASIGWGLLAVLGAYLGGWEVFQARRWALVTAAIFAFMPTFMHLTSAFTNDISAIAMGTLILAQALRIVRRGASPYAVLWLGFFFGVGILVKISVALLAPAGVLALVLDAWQQPQPVRRLIRSGVLLGGVVLVMVGPWLAFGWLTFDDPFGFETHITELSAYETPLSVGAVLALLPDVYLTYLGRFGASVNLQPATYTALGRMLLVALTGYAVYGGVRLRALFGHAQGSEAEVHRTPSLVKVARSVTGSQIAVLGMAMIVMLLGLIRWLQSIRFITGRLLYPAHLCTALLITGGLYLLARQMSRVGWIARVATVGVFAAVSLIGNPLAITAAYRQPELLTVGELPALQGEPIDFAGTVRLLGYDLLTPRITPDGLPQIALCWEALQPTERYGAFAVKVVHDGDIVASRTSLHGLGHYPSVWWAAGDRWCDTVTLAWTGTPQPGQVYDVLVDMLDVRSQDFDWAAALPDGTPLDLPFVAQMISPAGDMRASVEADLTPVDVAFPDLARLEGYALTGDATPGGSLTLDLLWQVTAETDTNWQGFVHVLSVDEAVPVAGGMPRGGNYPTWAWAVDEIVADAWTLDLPDDLPAGQYTLGLGFFQAEGGERLPAMVDGAPALDGIARLTTLSVE